MIFQGLRLRVIENVLVYGERFLQSSQLVTNKECSDLKAENRAVGGRFRGDVRTFWEVILPGSDVDLPRRISRGESRDFPGTPSRS